MERWATFVTGFAAWVRSQHHRLPATRRRQIDDVVDAGAVVVGMADEIHEARRPRVASRAAQMRVGRKNVVDHDAVAPPVESVPTLDGVRALEAGW